MGRTEEQQKQAALNLARRLPPQEIGKSLAGFIRLAPNLEGELLQRIDRPLKVEKDPSNNLPFIVCDFNADGGSHRSPWSNAYIPPRDSKDEPFYPSARLRKLEELFNEVFDCYKTSYYGGGVSSVYLWDLEEGFAGAFLIHKEVAESGERGVNKGAWDSIHILEVQEPANASSVHYLLTTTVLLNLEAGEEKGAEGFGRNSLGGHITRQVRDEKKKKQIGDEAHLIHIGKMIEEQENQIRKSFDAVYMQKQREVVDGMRSVEPLEESNLSNLPVELNAAISAKAINL